MNLDEELYQIRAAIQIDPTNPKNWLYQGQIYDAFNRWKEAEEGYRRFQQERVNYWLPYNELGHVLTIVGRYQEAIQAFQTASALAPKQALPLSNLGMVQFKVGNLAQAEQSLERSLTAKPSASAYSSRGETLRVKGRLAEAIASYREAIKYAPADDQGWFGIADCYAAMDNHHKQSSDAFQQAASAAERYLQQHPRNTSGWMRLALYRIKSHAIRESRECLKRAEENGPLEVDSAILKARILEIYGERKHALETIEWCLRLAPVRFEIENIKDLRSLTKDPAYLRILKVVAQVTDARVKKREHQ
jgi:superkiller protein 3